MTAHPSRALIQPLLVPAMARHRDEKPVAVTFSARAYCGDQPLDRRRARNPFIRANPATEIRSIPSDRDRVAALRCHHSCFAPGHAVTFFASSMPSGSKARTLAPAACRAGTISKLGLSRMSSVFGLAAAEAVVLPAAVAGLADDPACHRLLAICVDIHNRFDNTDGSARGRAVRRPAQVYPSENTSRQAGGPGMQKLAPPAVQSRPRGNVPDVRATSSQMVSTH